MKNPYEPLAQFCKEAESLKPQDNPFSPEVLEYVVATLKLFLASKEKSFDAVFRVKPRQRTRVPRHASYKMGSDARIAIRASRLRERSEMSWEEIAEQINFLHPEKLAELIEEYAGTIRIENRRKRS